MRLGGGQETSWRSGALVLKPLDMPAAELAWQAEALGALVCDGFRITRPIRTPDGSLVVDGWCAWEALEGRHEEGRWAEIIAVGDRFHAALDETPRPAFLDERTDRWATRDRVAWGELPAASFAHVKHVPRLVAAMRPLEAVSRLVHGDLTGNVLFADGLPPAVIDFVPYWRPQAYSSAIVVADALVWEGADESVLAAVAHVEEFPQYLLRALVFRAVTDRLFRADEPVRPDESDPYLPAVELACRIAVS
jgi:uncharacterized protein (TIGR02569 family)